MNTKLKSNSLLCVSLYCMLAFEAFQIETKGAVQVQLFDHHDILIRKEKFEAFVKAFWRGDLFHIKINYESDHSHQTVSVVSPQVCLLIEPENQNYDSFTYLCFFLRCWRTFSWRLNNLSCLLTIKATVF